MLLDGSEKLVTYGMDTTKNWWAITKPFEGSYRLIVNGNGTDVYKDIRQLSFSADGNSWACFLKDNTQWYFMSSDTMIELDANDVGTINFSPNSQHISYSFFQADREIVVFKDKKIDAYNRDFENYPRIYLSNNAEKYAWVSERGSGCVLVINGRETSVFDEIKPIGFWYDAGMLYAARTSDIWEIYKDNTPISDVYYDISETAINIKSNVAAAIASESSGKQIGIIISDEYYEPLTGNRYDAIRNLILHPTLPLLSYNARLGTQEFVVLNTAEYYGGSETTGPPEFTYDGSDLYFLGCDIHCFVNVNGRKYSLNGEIPIDRYFAKKPGDNTIAYATGSSMIVRDIETNELHAGIMVDELISPRYNWRNSTYETLGSIGNKLYLMTCRY